MPEVPTRLRKYGYLHKFFDKTPALTVEKLKETLSRPAIRVTRNCGKFSVHLKDCERITDGLTGMLSSITGVSKYTKNIINKRPRREVTLCTVIYKKVRPLLLKRCNYSMMAFTILVSAILRKNVPCDKEYVSHFAQKLYGLKKVTARAFKDLWFSQEMSRYIGISLDVDVKKAAFQIENARHHSTLTILETLLASDLEIVATNTLVTSWKTGDSKHCNVCESPCTPSAQLATEIDLICFHKKSKRVVLVELKSTGHSTFSKDQSKVYRTQTWLTWLMFANTYPTLAPFTTSVILAYSLTTQTTIGYQVIPMLKNSTLCSKIPFLMNWCSDMVGIMCPIGAKDVPPSRTYKTKKVCSFLPPADIIKSIIEPSKINVSTDIL